MVNTVRLYYNTGFNFENIPDSPDLLNTCFHRDLEGHWDYQDFFLSSLKLKVNWNFINNVDYIKYGNAYYFVVGITMHNENNAEVHLELDALTSMGGAENLEYITGIITRAHATDDTMFSNIIDEPVGCSEELQITAQTTTSGGDYAQEGGLTLVASTVDLSVDLENTIRTDYIDVVGASAELLIPTAPPTSKQTKIYYTAPDGTTYSDGDTDVYNVPFGYYDLSKDLTKKNLRILRSLGLETAALYSYVVPGDYANAGYATEEDPLNPGSTIVSNRITRLDGQRSTKNGDSFKSNYSNIKNNKTYSMYNYYVVRSNTSGDTKEYKATELGLNNSSTTPTFVVTADPQYGGCAYCSPLRFKGATIKNPTFESVQSLAWYDIPIAYTNLSGEYLYNNDYKLKVVGIGTETTNSLFNLGGSLLGGVGDMGNLGAQVNYDPTAQPGKNYTTTPISAGSVNAMLGVGTSALSFASKANTLLYKAQKVDAEYAQNKVIAPSLTAMPVKGLQRVLPNDFTIYHITPTAKDIRQIDKYFTYYGYAQPNIVFDKSYLTGRQYFNYLKCTNCKIMRDSNSDPFGIGIKSKAEQQLNNGVRIWHTLPQDVEANPII